MIKLVFILSLSAFSADKVPEQPSTTQQIQETGSAAIEKFREVGRSFLLGPLQNSNSPKEVKPAQAPAPAPTPIPTPAPAPATAPTPLSRQQERERASAKGAADDCSHWNSWDQFKKCIKIMLKDSSKYMPWD